MSLAARIRDFLLAPADAQSPSPQPHAPRGQVAAQAFLPPRTEPGTGSSFATPEVAEVAASAPRLAVLCGPRDAELVGTLVAGAMARRARCRAVVVAVWRHDARRPETSGRRGAARGAAARLAARDLPARAAGRAVIVGLPADPIPAAAMARRAAAAAGDAPFLLVLAGPRGEEFDLLLGACDRVLVAPPADAPDGVAELALLDAARIARAAAPLELPRSPVIRGLARAGLVTLPSVREALGAPA